MLKITPSELKVFAAYIKDISGIALDQSKAYLLETRLGNIAQELGCTSFSEFYFKAKADAIWVGSGHQITRTPPRSCRE